MIRAARVLTFAAAAFALVAGSARAQEPDQTTAPRYIRIVEGDDGNTVRLQLAARSFVPDPARRDGGPTIWLAAAVHIGDPSYYRALQESLDAKDVVLYEGVRPPGAGLLEHSGSDLSDDDRARITRKRIRLLMVATEMHRRQTGDLPDSIAALDQSIGEKLGRFVDACATDGWGHPIEFSRITRQSTPQTAVEVQFGSRGSDGEIGGDGPAADIWSQELPALKPSEVPDTTRSDGLQSQLAKAFGLVFQLDEMHHSKPNWRNSDLSIDQIEQRISGDDEYAASELFSSLEGSSAAAKLAGVVLKVIGMFPSLSAIGKVLLLELLSQADDVLGIVPAEMSGLMDVIVKDRNEVVLADLRRVVENEPGIRTAAIIYGAGHMPGLEEAILGELGYKDGSAVWLNAIEVDLRDTGLPPAEVRALRKTLRDTLKQQIKAMSRQRGRD